MKNESLNFVPPLSLRTSDKHAIFYSGKIYTYKELEGYIEDSILLQSSAGAKAGDRIAIILPSSPAFVAHFLAAQRAGLAAMPLNPLLGAREIDHILSTMRPELIVLPPEEFDAPAVGAVRKLITKGENYKALNCSSLAKNVKALTNVSDPMQFENTTDREALILFTSGTSGIPKGASHLDGNVYRNALESNKVLSITESDVIISPLPFSHTFGQSVIMLGSLLAGAELVIPENSNVNTIISDMDTSGATFLASVPTTFAGMAEYARVDPSLCKRSTRNLRLALTGGSPLPKATSDKFYEAFNIPVHQGYGMTEVACCISLEDPSLAPRRSVGKVFSMHDYRIVSDQKGISECLEGELELSGPNLLTGYYIDGKLNRREPNDWFPTGDLVRELSTGEIVVFDRKKDMIIRNGYNVYPSEVETALATHPQVVLSAVMGVPDDKVGQEIAAFVELTDGATITPTELAQWCREQVAPYKYPRLMAFLPQLPKNASGKILKLGLQTKHLKRIKINPAKKENDYDRP